MIRINMRSAAWKIKSQGVCSCYDEQVSLVKNYLPPEFKVYENRMGKFDIVHYHTVNPTYFIERLLNRRISVGIGYVHFIPETIDDSLRLPRLFKKVFYKYLLAFYNSMDYLVTVNPFFISKIHELGIKKPEVLCIPNYVSSKNFYQMSQSEKEKIRESYGIGQKSFVVLGVGQLQTRKGIIDFVETARRLPQVQFVWAGGFSFGKMSMGYDEIKRLTENPPENVRFLGIVPREKMNHVYNMADLFFLPSYEELFPMSVLEAMSCRLPVLVRDIPLYESILFNAYLKGGNTEAFVDAITKIRQNPSVLNEWREKAWQCHLHYTENYILNEWKQLYGGAYAKVKEKQAVAMVFKQ